LKFKAHTCTSCDQSFCTKKELKLHKLKNHNVVANGDSTLKPEPSGRYVCACTREFTYPSRILDHQRYCKRYRLETGNFGPNKLDPSFNTGDFKCFKCQRCFTYRSNLIRHQKSTGHLDSTQLNSMTHQCDRCLQKFFTPESLDKHFKRNSCNAPVAD
jgi:uncharacterized Zn-finger protein